MTKRSSRQACWVVGWSILLICAPPAPAHDSWVMASENSIPGPGAVRLAFATAEQFPTSEYATKPNRVDKWFVRIGNSKQDVRGFRIEGKELVAKVNLEKPGVHVIAASLHPHFMEFEAEKFEAYLAEEFAKEAASLRHKRGQRKTPGRMNYTKLTKTFVQVGERSADDYAKPIGHTLEIIPLSNPCRRRVGDEVTVRVLYEGKPAAGMCVSSTPGGLAPHTFVENVFTDAKGEARLKLTRPGPWLFRVHHIRPNTHGQKADNQPLEDSPQADWESFWTSITFRVHEK